MQIERAHRVGPLAARRIKVHKDGTTRLAGGVAVPSY